MKGNTTTNINSLRRICFTGIRGVGKTTLLKEIDEQIPEIVSISGSDILQDLMGETYNQFEFLPEKEKYIHRLKLNDVRWEIQREAEKDMLVDCHLTVYNLKTGKIDMIFTHKDFDFFTEFILLDSTPKKIQTHRKRDTTKKRIVELAIIKRELDFERKMALKITKDYGIKLHIVQMDERAIDNLNRIIGNDI